MRERLLRLFQPASLALVWLPIAAITVLHYATPHHAHGIHDVARRLFYLPIVFAGLRAGLPGGMVAAAVVILVGGGLLGRSFSALLSVDLGFEPEGVVALQAHIWVAGRSATERVTVAGDMLERMEAIPGVTAAGLVLTRRVT